MAETTRINSDPVSDLRWLPRFGRSYKVPVGCLGCEALTATSAAESVGLRKIETPRGTRYLPENKEYEAEQELDRRVTNAAIGTCKFIFKVSDCWRVESIKE